MAEFGAHMATKAEPNRASIFELLAQESLSDGLRNAFQYLLNVCIPKLETLLNYDFPGTRRSEPG